MKVFVTTFLVLFLGVSFAWAKKPANKKSKPASTAKAATPVEPVDEVIPPPPKLKSGTVVTDILLDEPVRVSSKFVDIYLYRENLGQRCALVLLIKNIGRGGPTEVPTYAELIGVNEVPNKGWSVYKVIDDKKRKYKLAVFPDMRNYEGEGRQNDLITVCQ
jgi:hypothetical protein